VKRRFEPTLEEAAANAVAVELGAERSRALVRELLTTAPQNIATPRYLTWDELADGGLLITTDKARFIVAADQVEVFCPSLARMVRPELIRGPPAGSC
jgi:hypothetical protein